MTIPKQPPQLLPRLSAHALKQYQDCPRKFALRYKVGRYWPAAERTERAHEGDPLALGSAFHQLVHQQVLGLDVDGALSAYHEALPELERLWGSFVASPYVEPPALGRVWTEQVLHFTLAGVSFEVRYDRLLAEGGRWTILDWKTGKIDPVRLADDWQTKLYLFALVEAGAVLNDGAAISPEAVRIVYWEVKTGTQCPIPYDAARHEAIRRELTLRAQEVLPTFDEHAPDDGRFPKKAAHCDRCHYDSLCNRQALPEPQGVTLSRPRFIS